MHAATDAGVFALGVLTHDDPIEVLWSAALEWRVDAGQDARRTHIGILVKTLTDLQAQPPESDVIRNMRVTGRAKQNGVLLAQGVQAVGRHHLAVRAVPVATPAEVLEFEAETAAA